ncbi:MAG: MurR/RpiR family transcriptional regulator, partial [Culicoidibacterales bacterium]
MEYTVFEQIQMYSHQFTMTDQKIASFIKKHPEFLQTKGITDIAKAANVSAAGVSRFCQKVGYSGFNALKFSLLKEQNCETQILIEQPCVEAELCDDYITFLRRSVLNLNQKTIDHFITQIKIAKKISVYGLGSSGLIAQELATKLKRIGFETTASIDSHAMVIDASLAQQNQVIIAFTHTGQTRELNYAIE